MQKPAVYSLLMAVLLLFAGSLYAQDADILDLKPPMSAPGQTMEEPDLKEGEFDGYGVIDRITAQELVIDDATYRLSGTTTYKYMDGSSASADNFPVGTRVWFMLYTDNIIESVWKEGG